MCVGGGWCGLSDGEVGSGDICGQEEIMFGGGGSSIHRLGRALWRR